MYFSVSDQIIDYLFSATFQIFFWFMKCVFDKLAIFLILHFGRQANGGL